MWKKAAFLLLISCILLQVASAKHPRWKVDIDESDSKESNESSSDSDSSEELVSHGNLFGEFLTIYSEFITSVTGKGKSVAKDFIENKLISKVKSTSMNAIIESFAKYLNVDVKVPRDLKSNDVNSILQYFTTSMTSLTDYLMLVDKYSPQSLKEPNAEEVLIQEALQEADADDLLEEVPNRFDDFYKSFGDKVRSYIKQLSALERESETKLVDWYDEFKAASGFDNKIKEIRQFFSIYV